MNLEKFFNENKKVALCFSGGADSAYLLYAGVKYGADIAAYFLKTEFQPEFEFEDAKNMAKQLGKNLVVKELSVLDNEKIIKNTSLRCYHCKNTGLAYLAKSAREDGFDVIIDGTNADDNPEDRPGMKALEELGIISPLRICNMTKKEIRELSKEANLFTWDKPAYACLATRIPQNTKITKEDLKKVENSETVLFKMGFVDFRVRKMGDIAKLEIREEDFEKAIKFRKEILDKLDFREVVLNLKERKSL